MIQRLWQPTELCERKGKERHIVAVGHTNPEIVYHMLKNQQGIVSLRIGHKKLAKRVSSLRCDVAIDFLWK